MTRLLVLLIAEVLLLLALPRAILSWLGRRNPYYAAAAKRFDRLITVLIAALLLFTVAWPLAQLAYRALT